MIESPDALQIVRRPRVTVAAIAEHEGRFLLVEERNSDRILVLNQPAGHVEADESLAEAVIREALEETGYHFVPEYLVGIYLWGKPGDDRSFLRVCFAGSAVSQVADAKLDPDIERPLWLTREELETESARWRSPLVARCIDDYLAGERYPLLLLKSLLPA
jgi:ADP-ribose pyrophosphatase YjhB (NUDIX family)